MSLCCMIFFFHEHIIKSSVVAHFTQHFTAEWYRDMTFNHTHNVLKSKQQRCWDCRASGTPHFSVSLTIKSYWCRCCRLCLCSSTWKVELCFGLRAHSHRPCSKTTSNLNSEIKTFTWGSCSNGWMNIPTFKKKATNLFLRRYKKCECTKRVAEAVFIQAEVSVCFAIYSCTWWLNLSAIQCLCKCFSVVIYLKCEQLKGLVPMWTVTEGCRQLAPQEGTVTRSEEQKRMGGGEAGEEQGQGAGMKWDTWKVCSFSSPAVLTCPWKGIT